MCQNVDFQWILMIDITGYQGAIQKLQSEKEGP